MNSGCIATHQIRTGYRSDFSTTHESGPNQNWQCQIRCVFFCCSHRHAGNKSVAHLKKKDRIWPAVVSSHSDWGGLYKKIKNKKAEKQTLTHSHLSSLLSSSCPCLCSVLLLLQLPRSQLLRHQCQLRRLWHFRENIANKMSFIHHQTINLPFCNFKNDH